MRYLKLFRWTAALMAAIALAPAAAFAQADGTITISGTFSMDYLSGESDLDWYLPGLAEVYFNGHEHTWTLTLHGTTPSHTTNGAVYTTQIHATSFDLEFFGPDATTLNGVVSGHLAKGNVGVSLVNKYDDNGGGFAKMYFSVSGGDPGVYRGTYFETGYDIVSNTLFPTDADGYPVVGPEPFSIERDYIELGYFEMFSGTGGYIESLGSLVTFERRVGELPGDFNFDGVVNGRDLLAWQRNPGLGSLGDWQTNYGIGPTNAGNIAIPEPRTQCLTSALVVLFLVCQKRRLAVQGQRWETLMEMAPSTDEIFKCGSGTCASAT